MVHTGQWPKECVNLTGMRVGSIGTGSSGVQAIPVIAEQCDELIVFQRTPQYTVPARNAPLQVDRQTDVKSRYRDFREANFLMPQALGAEDPKYDDSIHDVSDEERRERLQEAWDRGGTLFLASFTDVLLDESANFHAQDFVREKIGEIVSDPETASKLTPEHIIGCKRLVIDTDYFETFNRPNVRLVDVGSEPIQRITESGLSTQSEEFQFDDWFDIAGRHNGSRGNDDPGEVVSRSTHLPRTYRSRVPQHVHGVWAGKSFRAYQHDYFDRTACRMDQ